MSDTPQLLLAHHLKELKLPTLLARIRQVRSAMRRRGRRSSPLFAAPGRTRTDSSTGKTHIALGLGLAACQKGLSVGFITAAALVHELIEARDEKRLLRLQRQLAAYKLLIIDELGYVPLSTTGAELLFEVFSQRYERASTIVTSNLPFDEWTRVFGSPNTTRYLNSGTTATQNPGHRRRPSAVRSAA